jgi:hypothetical protein
VIEQTTTSQTEKTKTKTNLQNRGKYREFSLPEAEATGLS